MRPFDRRDAWWLAVVVLVGVGIRWGVFGIGPIGDDYIQHGMVQGLYPGPHPAWDLYRLYDATPEVRAAHLQVGYVPWWTAPDVYGSVLRPIPSLLVWIDHGVFARRPVVHRAHTLVWWALAIVAAGVVLRRLFDRPLAWVAVAIFALDQGVTRPVTFHANRAVLVSAAIGFFALWVHLRWRAGELPRGRLWTLLAMSATVATGEYGLVIAGYVASYELLAGGLLRAGWRTAVGRLWPTFVPVAAFMTAHVLGGYGTIGSEYYAHPFDTPIGYLRWAALRVPRMLADLVVSMPAAADNFVARYGWDPSTLVGAPGFRTTILGHTIVAAGVLVAVAVVAVVLRPGLGASERRTLRWLAIGAVLGTLPVSVAPSHSRLLVLSHLGAVAFVAGLVVAGARLAAGRIAASAWRRIVGGLTALGLGWLHGPADVDFGRRMIVNFARFDQDVRAIVASPLARGESWAGRDVLLMSAKGLNVALHGPLVADYHGWPVPRSWHVLSSTHAPLNVRRTGPRTLELFHMMNATWLATEVDRAFCPRPRTLPTGTVIDTGVFVLRVLADVDGRPTHVELTFPAPLEDPRYAFVFLRGKQLVPFVVPPVGHISFVPLPNESSTSERIPPPVADLAVPNAPG